MKILLFLLLSLAISVLRAEEFVFPKELKLEAAFPTNSTITRHTLPWGEGELQQTVISYIKDGARVMLIVDTPIPAAVKRDPTRGFEIAKETVLSTLSVKLVKDEPLIIGEWKGRRYVFEEAGKARIEQRLFIVDDSLYMFGVGASGLSISIRCRRTFLSRLVKGSHLLPRDNRCQAVLVHLNLINRDILMAAA